MSKNSAVIPVAEARNSAIRPDGGVVNLLKPPGMTSQNAVSHVKRILGVSKAGHAGTLDPEACGVLPICIGRATKYSRFLTDGSKEYIAELTLGRKTDTLDSWGSVVCETAPAAVSGQEVRAAASQFTGKIMQVPPAYSAVKIDGKPLYRYARNGEKAAAAARPIEVHAIELLRGHGTGPFLFRIRCSKGTYVRVLLSDIAETLGQTGYTSFLIRTCAGRFRIEDACTFAELEADAADEGTGSLVLGAGDASPGVRLDVPAYLFRILETGSRILPEKVRGLRIEPGVLYAVFCSGEYFGVGEFDGTGLVLRARIRV